MSDLMNIYNRKKNVITLDGKDYEVNTSAELAVDIERAKRVINKKSKEDSEYNLVEAQFELLFDVITLSVSEEFSNKIRDMKLSEDDLMKTVNIIGFMREGKTFEEALEALETPSKN